MAGPNQSPALFPNSRPSSTSRWIPNGARGWSENQDTMARCRCSASRGARGGPGGGRVRPGGSRSFPGGSRACPEGSRVPPGDSVSILGRPASTPGGPCPFWGGRVHPGGSWVHPRGSRVRPGDPVSGLGDPCPSRGTLGPSRGGRVRPEGSRVRPGGSRLLRVPPGSSSSSASGHVQSGREWGTLGGGGSRSPLKVLGSHGGFGVSARVRGSLTPAQQVQHQPLAQQHLGAAQGAAPAAVGGPGGPGQRGEAAPVGEPQAGAEIPSEPRQLLCGEGKAGVGDPRDPSQNPLKSPGGAGNPEQKSRWDRAWCSVRDKKGAGDPRAPQSPPRAPPAPAAPRGSRSPPFPGA